MITKREKGETDNKSLQKARILDLFMHENAIYESQKKYRNHEILPFAFVVISSLSLYPFSKRLRQRESSNTVSALFSALH